MHTPLVTATAYSVPLPAHAWQLLYRSEDSTGAPTAEVTTVLVPDTAWTGAGARLPGKYDSRQQRYQLFAPPTWKPTRTWPLVVFVSPGDDPLGWRAWRKPCEDADLPFAAAYGVGNSCPPGQRVRALLDVLDDVRKHYRIDPDRSAVTFRTRHLFGLAPVRGRFDIKAGTVDIAAERRRLERDLAAARKEAQSMTAKLGNEAFTAKAPAEVIEKSRARLAVAEADIARLESRLAALS